MSRHALSNSGSPTVLFAASLRPLKTSPKKRMSPARKKPHAVARKTNSNSHMDSGDSDYGAVRKGDDAEVVRKTVVELRAVRQLRRDGGALLALAYDETNPDLSQLPRGEQMILQSVKNEAEVWARLPNRILFAAREQLDREL